MSSVLVIGTNKRKKEIRISERLSDSNIQSAVKVRVRIRAWIQKFWTERALANTPNLWINIWHFEFEPIYYNREPRNLSFNHDQNHEVCRRKWSTSFYMIPLVSILIIRDLFVPYFLFPLSFFSRYIFSLYIFLNISFSFSSIHLSEISREQISRDSREQSTRKDSW